MQARVRNILLLFFTFCLSVPARQVPHDRTPESPLRSFVSPASVWRASEAGDRIVLGYYPAWMRWSYPHTLVPYQHLTHIAHAFIFPYSDGTLDFSNFQLYPELILSAHQRGVNAVISVGGWDEARTPRFSQMAADSAARRRFVEQLKDFCIANGYDGADIDWEYPRAADRAAVSLLFTELRQAFSSVVPPLSLSIAAPATDWQGGYDWNVMKEVLDWVGVMTYDFHGSWSISGPNSPLYSSASVHSSVVYYRAKGVPSSKIVVGVPFYGWQFNAPRLYVAHSGASQVIYKNIAPLLQQGWTRVWDDATKIPHLINPESTKVISYDDSLSISEKIRYVKNENLGGVIIWALGQDYLSDGRQPLLSAVGEGFEKPATEPHPVASDIPSVFALYQNYPNPFNAQTRIGFAVPVEGHYSLRLSDLIGREMRVLADGRYAPGTYEVTLVAGDLSSGVYVYRLTGGSVALARTLIVVR